MINEINNTDQLLTIKDKAEGAFLGAAIGDALGWPNEFNSRNIKSKDRRKEPNQFKFAKWTRKAGGQYYPHEVAIEEGEYSDDTQLILATARSLSANSWFKHFSQRELPLWTLYERGGGGATKRAANIWSEGKEPWHPEVDVVLIKKYFEAGGNGVAMRIMPHVFYHARRHDFIEISRDILLNGICTHGHPRALVGALAYGYALFTTIFKDTTLKYGELVDKLLSSFDEWSAFPDFNEPYLSSWLRSANEFNNGDYLTTWRNAALEMKHLVEIGQDGIGQGALSVDQNILTKLGCFDKKVSGSGTITSMAAIFLASRYAADPKTGLLEAANLEGADTDTIASMTGGLLGSIAGLEWQTPISQRIQDAEYISSSAKIVSNIENKQASEISLIDKAVDYPPKTILLQIIKSKMGDHINLRPDLEFIVKNVISHKSLLSSIKARSWKLEAFGGQTIYVKKISRTPSDSNKKTMEQLKLITPIAIDRDLTPVVSTKIFLKLYVNDLVTSRSFYEKGLGLTVTKDDGQCIVLNDMLVLKKKIDEGKQKTRRIKNTDEYKSPNLICIGTKSIESTEINIKAFHVQIIRPIILNKQKKKYLHCLDPDGNLLEIIQVEH